MSKLNDPTPHMDETQRAYFMLGVDDEAFDQIRYAMTLPPPRMKAEVARLLDLRQKKRREVIG